jgi:OmcA/MtrC family decaheme c-type cytochrome
MHSMKNRALTLLATLAVAVAGCQGEKGPAGSNGAKGADGTNGTNGTGTNGTNGTPGANGTNGTAGTNGTNGTAGVNSATSGLKLTVSSVTIAPTTNVAAVRFTLKDDQGYPVDLQGKSSVNTAFSPRLAIARIDKAADGSVLPYTVFTKSGTPASPTALTAPAVGAAATTSGQIVDNGSGDYTYTFPPSAAVDGTKLAQTHTVWIQLSRQTDLDDTTNTRTFTTVNAEYNFIPGSNAAPEKREIVLTANCNKCHAGFKPQGLTSNGFHGSGRIEAPFCNVCHNAARVSAATNSDGVTPAASSAVFVHRIHKSMQLQAANVFHGINEVTYPQDIRNCAACHGGAAQGDQSKTKPSRAACGSCHDYVDFTGAAVVLACTSPISKDANGIPVPCAHLGGQQLDDVNCAGCHAASGDKHVSVAPPDSNSTYAGGTNANTNAAYLAAAGAVPAGAAKITYDVKSVQAVTDASVTPNVLRPQITFKLKMNGTDVVFNDPAAKPELVDNFVGSPSVYFAFAVPQDGIATPADFNASASGYIKGIWNGAATGTGKGTIAFDAATGYYTITLTGVQIPAAASMLTAGVGYTYALTATQPLTQTNVPGYPYAANKTGGLIVPAANVWKTATGYSARRDIVDNAKCQTCHVTLGASPTFHAGQRNDGPTCSFCHNPNRTSSGWSANAKDFIHSLHAGNQLSTKYTWHAESATEGFWEISFPSRLNNCEACHKPNTYDFSLAASKDALPNLLWSAVATGKFDGASATAFQFSPFVIADNTTTYGAGFAFNAGTAVTTAPTAGALVTSPITAACVACHDNAPAKAHMQANGGSFYAARLSLGALPGAVEQCLICHGSQPNAIAPIADFHK